MLNGALTGDVNRSGATGRQSAMAVGCRVFFSRRGGEGKMTGHLRSRPSAGSAHTEAVQARHHHVEDDEVRVVIGHRGERSRPLEGVGRSQKTVRSAAPKTTRWGGRCLSS